MATIDKLDLSVYNLYAIRTKMIEQINEDMRLSEASTIPPQIQVVDIFPKLTELDLVLGVVPLNTPWAYFFPPKQVHTLRRSPFAFYRVIPSMGTTDEQSKDEEKLDKTECQTPEEQKEKEAIKKCFTQIDKINEWLSFIVGRVGQFLQG